MTMEDSKAEENQESGVSQVCEVGEAKYQHCGKRKHEEENENENENENEDEHGKDKLWKTSLCSFFRRPTKDCKHGDKCRFAHGEHELRPRPDNTWDPTSQRAQKIMKMTSPQEEDQKQKEEHVAQDEGAAESQGGGVVHLRKCVLNLPKNWNHDRLKELLERLKISYVSAKKNKLSCVGFIEFSCAEDVTSATEKLNGHVVNKKSIKLANVQPRSWEKHKLMSGGRDNLGLKSADVEKSENNDGKQSLTDTAITDVPEQIENKESAESKSVVKQRKARDAVTPLADMHYEEQLQKKKNSLAQLLKKLTRNARKACPTASLLPQWIHSARNQGDIACNLEGIVRSPLVNGYRNKCEFTIGLSGTGERVVGFLLGNFREGVTAVEEPSDCPNVSSIACQYAMILQNFIRSSELSLWDKYQNKGFWRLLTVREGRSLSHFEESNIHQNVIAEVMLIVQICSKDVEEKLRLIELKRMAEAFALAAATASPPLPLTSLIVQDHLGICNAAPSDAPLFPLPIPVMVNGELHLDDCKQPKSQIHDYVSNLCFRISPTAFFQVNTLAAEKLYSLAGDWAGLSPSTLLFDICCGTGTIGLTLAHRAGLVIGIEMVAAAVEDAQRNAELNGIENCKFICAKAEDVVDKLLDEYLEVEGEPSTEISEHTAEKDAEAVSKEHGDTQDNDVSQGSDEPKVQVTEPDSISAPQVPENGKKRYKDVVVIVDPPRCGLHPSVLRALRTHSLLRRLVYISCNPESLIANAIELCTPSPGDAYKAKNRGGRGGLKFMGKMGHARQRLKSMPVSEPFSPVKAMAVDLFPHTVHCEMVMLFQR